MTTWKIMLDLETLSTKPTAAIIAIGAVAFTDTDERKFYQTIRPTVGDIDFDTVAWWTKQSDSARQSTFTGEKSTRQVLEELTDFFYSHQPTEVWGNGAAFDNVILCHSYQACGMTPPWSYDADRCFRTLREIHPPAANVPFLGTFHNALDDAIHQVRVLRQIYAENNIAY